MPVLRRRTRLPKGLKRHLNILLTADEYEALITASMKQGQTLAGYARQSLRDRLIAEAQYYYVKVPGGGYWPPITEVGFSDFSNAKIAAAKKDGVVVRHRLEEVQEIPAEAATS